MLTIKAMTGGETYAAHHLSNNDYYSVGETVTGQWVGRGAELLGLQGAVDLADFDAIREGLHPKTGEFLRPRVSADRFSSEGVKIGTARNLYDFTVSGPKDLSIQAMEDPRLLEAHRAGVEEMVREMERHAATRVRRFGANSDRETSNLVIARYDHDTSRELDPQLHTHLVAGNLTFDGAERKWKALQASAIYERREYLTEVYRNAAARVVLSFGYEIENRQEHGREYGFGIAGIRPETREKFSRRSAQRDAAIADFTEKNGRMPSHNEIAQLVRDTRAEKLTEITTAQVKAQQYSRLAPEEAQTLKQLHRQALEQGSIEKSIPAAPSLTFAREHVFERVSVAKDYELTTHALRHGRGRVELPAVQAELAAQVAAGQMLSARGEVATKDSLERERRMVAAIDGGMSRYSRLGGAERFVVSDRLRPEQKQAVLAILDSRDFAINLRGAAGTGKTTTLEELHRGIAEAGRIAVAVAPTVSAVEELRKAGFQEAVTMSRLLSDVAQQERLRGQVLIVDEAGMVASKDMAALIGVAQAQKARIVFSGDTAQLKSVEEGDALRVLERESQLRSVSLVDVQRQATAEYKAAVEALRSKPYEGYERLAAMGAIREVPWLTRGREVSQAYREAARIPNLRGEERSILVVAATHDEIRGITHAIRQDRKNGGELGYGETITRHSALNWTEAQRKQTQNYQPGQLLVFHKAVKNMAAQKETLEVVDANRRFVTARRETGETVRITEKQAAAYGVFEAGEMEVAKGDKLLLQANWREKGRDAFKATNGELVTVESVSRGHIRLTDGRELPDTYKQFTHGYAVTAHRSQGKTVDYEVIAADRMSRELFYVATTRAREGLTIITSDAATLQESIGISGDRQSAIELARRAKVSGPSVGHLLKDDSYRLWRESVGQAGCSQERRSHVTEQRTGIGY